MSGTGFTPAGGMMAFLQRREGLSADQFTRYWRDVHGVLASRIPGMHVYVQHHLVPEPARTFGATASGLAVDGIAEVVLADERAVNPNPVIALIGTDEQHVFSSAVNFSLPGSAVAGWRDPAGPGDDTQDGRGAYVLVRSGPDVDAAAISAVADAVAQALVAVDGIETLVDCDLTAGTSSWWATPGVDNDTEGSVHVRSFRVRATSGTQAPSSLTSLTEALGGIALTDGVTVAVHDITGTYVMVADGRPTMLGLRGLSAQQTIEELSAVAHQDSDDVRAALFVAP